ncbi:MAG: Uma2 family endonuclease [Acidobacteria bacterium]|nr:Uma2 family endonuclease [Acidobacteriota bacterium]
MQRLGPHRWTREIYDRMVAGGFFAPGERVELIDGEILTVTPQGTAHAVSVRLARKALEVAFGAGFEINVQLPLALDAMSEPEPDLSVTRGRPRDFLESHPTPAETVLIAEIADSTLEHDRLIKGGLYARASIPEYWVVNLIDRHLEVFRNPRPDAQAPLGFRYSEALVIRTGEAMTPLFAPASLVNITDLLP